MFRRLFPIIAVLVAASVVSAADYMFPSPRPPANLPTTNTAVKQYVSVIFDDNAYSGGTGTQYEAVPNATWAQSGWVGGTGGGTNNPLNVTETVNPIGIAWAKNALGNKTNPGGAKIHMTFNLITGVFCPTWGASWQDRQSKFGSYVDPAQPYVAGVSGFLGIARAWGREYAIGTTKAAYNDGQKDAITPMDSLLIKAGHEIGNHTIDHMEPNSPLPKDTAGFQKWNNEGFDPGTDLDNEGNPFTPNEQTYYGLASNSWALTNGWEMYAGNKISVNAWAKYIALSEAQLKQYLHMQGAGTDIFGFRAPRLETNSNQFYALKQLGYQYDGGLEEGYEEYTDVTNPVWPYTTDNGTPNSYVQKSNGEKIYLDSMPSGLWEVPLNCFVIPQALRAGIYSKYHQISKGAGEPWALNAALALADSISWMSHGKISGLDFNMFILWGMTGSEFLQTMIYNLDQRLSHGKAPMQLACHTDYYSPIYDNATLQLPINLNAYGLVISKGWNTYATRQAALSAFLDTAIKRGCNVVSGHELVVAMKALQATDAPTPTAGYTLSGVWTFGNNAGVSTATPASATGDNITSTVTFGVGENVDCGYLFPVAAGSLSGLTHVSLNYKSNTPLEIRLICGTKSYKALLNNVGPEAASGPIPISAFVRDDTVGYTPALTVAQITGIEIAPLKIGAAASSKTFTVSNLKTYGVQTGVITRTFSNSLGGIFLARISSSSVLFSAPTAGTYMVSLYALDGKLVRSCAVTAAKPGMAHGNFTGKLSPNMYIVKIAGNAGNMVAKTLVSSSM